MAYGIVRQTRNVSYWEDGSRTYEGVYPSEEVDGMYEPRWDYLEDGRLGERSVMAQTVRSAEIPIPAWIVRGPPFRVWELNNMVPPDDADNSDAYTVVDGDWVRIRLPVYEPTTDSHSPMIVGHFRVLVLDYAEFHGDGSHKLVADPAQNEFVAYRDDGDWFELLVRIEPL